MRFLLSVLVLCGATYAGWHFYPDIAPHADPYLAKIKASIDASSSKNSPKGNSSAEERTGGALTDNDANLNASGPSTPLGQAGPIPPNTPKVVPNPQVSTEPSTPLVENPSLTNSDVPGMGNPAIEPSQPLQPSTPRAVVTLPPTPDIPGIGTTPSLPTSRPNSGSTAQQPKRTRPKTSSSPFGEVVTEEEEPQAPTPAVLFTTTAELFVTTPDKSRKITIPAKTQLPISEIRGNNVVVDANSHFNFKALLPKEFFTNGKGEQPTAQNIVYREPKKIRLLGEKKVKTGVASYLKTNKIKSIPIKSVKSFKYLGQIEFMDEPCEAAEIEYSSESIFGETRNSARAIFMDGKFKGCFPADSTTPLR